MRLLLFVLPLALAGAAFELMPEPPQQTQSPAPAPAVASAPPADIAAVQEPHTKAPPVTPVQVTTPQPETTSYPRSTAVTALRESMLNGDSRTPPLAPSRAQERTLPSAEELADPALYQAYEARQQQDVYASFVAAAEKKMAEVELALARARQSGLEPEQIAEGEKKLSKLREQRTLLLTQYPELNQPNTDNPTQAEAP